MPPTPGHPGTRSRRRGLPVLVLPALLLSGCFNPSVRIDGRSALEQQLTRSAIVRSVDQLAFRKDVLYGEWRIVVIAPDSQDESWIRGCLHRRLLELGATVTTEARPNVSQVVANVEYAGTDLDNFYVGLPVPGTGGQAVSFYQSITERGRAAMFLTFLDPHGRDLGSTPTAKGDTHYTAVYVMTLFGPFSFNDVDVRTDSRFTELGEDTWRQSRRSLNQVGDWILPDEPEDAEED